MAKEGAKKNAVPAARAPLSIVIAVLELIGLFFMAIGTPFDQIKITGTHPLMRTGFCYSVWGTKYCGARNPGTWHDAEYYKTCGVFEATMKGAAAFSIVALFAFALGATTSIMLACKCMATKIPVVLILLFGVVASAVPFAAIAGVYQNSQCDVRFKDIGSLQPGFAFFVVSFAMAVISFVLSCAA